MFLKSRSYVTEAAEAGGCSSGGGEGGPDQGVGDEQAARARGPEPAPQGAESPLQPAAGTAEEAHGRDQFRAEPALHPPQVQHHSFHQVSGLNLTSLYNRHHAKYCPVIISYFWETCENLYVIEVVIMQLFIRKSYVSSVQTFNPLLFLFL